MNCIQADINTYAASVAFIVHNNDWRYLTHIPNPYSWVFTSVLTKPTRLQKDKPSQENLENTQVDQVLQAHHRSHNALPFLA